MVYSSYQVKVYRARLSRILERLKRVECDIEWERQRMAHCLSTPMDERNLQCVLSCLIHLQLPDASEFDSIAREADSFGNVVFGMLQDVNRARKRRKHGAPVTRSMSALLLSSKPQLDHGGRVPEGAPGQHLA